MTGPNRANKITPAVVRFCGAELHLLAEGALWWPEHKLLIVSDLHFGKGMSYASSGQLLPPFDTDATLTCVERLIDTTCPKMCISLGDSFHREDTDQHLCDSTLVRIQRLTEVTTWIWIEGNHDPAPPDYLGGQSTSELKLDRLIFRHEPTGALGEVAGHLHPVAKVKAAGRHVRRKCFVTDGRSFILPSLGAYTGGLNVCDPAFRACLAAPLRTFALGQSQVFELDQKRLIGDRLRA